MKALIPVDIIEKKILLIRGEKVMLDVDLAELYGVETKMLVRAVKRNIDRFPSDLGPGKRGTHPIISYEEGQPKRL
jgi:hypothetical protein